MKKKMYAIGLSFDTGEFSMIFRFPQPFYETEAEAENIRQKLIEAVDEVNEENTRIEVWEVTETKY